MLKILFSLAIIFPAATAVAQEKIDNILSVYRKEALPYLNQIAKKEFNSPKTNPSTIARLNEFKAIIDTEIKQEVNDVCKRHLVTDNLAEITVTVDSVYKKHFRLPVKFYETAKEDAQKKP
jgi:hypothetical protein